MTHTRLFVSGPMTGLPDYNLPAFEEAADKLRAAGYGVCNPGRRGVIRTTSGGTSEASDSYEWRDYMRAAIRDLLDCDAVAVLPGWEHSKGSRLEVTIASDLDMPVHTVGRWLAASKRVGRVR